MDIAAAIFLKPSSNLGFRKMATAMSICARAASRGHFPEAPGSRRLHLRTEKPLNSGERALFLQLRSAFGTCACEKHYATNGNISKMLHRGLSTVLQNAVDMALMPVAFIYDFWGDRFPLTKKEATDGNLTVGSDYIRWARGLVYNIIECWQISTPVQEGDTGEPVRMMQERFIHMKQAGGQHRKKKGGAGPRPVTRIGPDLPQSPFNAQRWIGVLPYMKKIINFLEIWECFPVAQGF
ncbi:unnamed protein product [Ranitomeya imitator]|uniref:Uncharacterized protein n=1 Tax=Ranitomeya imitator TaxID=111125 RepID=A0ABN9LD36_9NEOB|nr:unnamed protein product [Ranitomeya imitator]